MNGPFMFLVNTIKNDIHYVLFRGICIFVLMLLMSFDLTTIVNSVSCKNVLGIYGIFLKCLLAMQLYVELQSQTYCKTHFLHMANILIIMEFAVRIWKERNIILGPPGQILHHNHAKPRQSFEWQLQKGKQFLCANQVTR